MKYIDLHLHTNYSDGQHTVKELLEKCENAKLSIISITDHDAVGAYYELENAETRNLFSGKIIVGTELSFNLDDHLYDVLGYNIDYQKMSDLLNKRMNAKEKIKMQEDLLEEWKEVCQKLQIRFDSNLKVTNGTNHEAFNVLYDDICNFEKYPENAKYKEYIAPENRAAFYKKEFSNPHSQFFVNEARYSPSLKEAIAMIHECGGKAFLAHAYAYGLEDVINFMKDGVEQGLDGIEMYYSTFTEAQTQTIGEFCQKNNLLVCGGTDFHGKDVKPGIEVGIGKGNMQVPEDIISNW